MKLKAYVIYKIEYIDGGLGARRKPMGKRTGIIVCDEPIGVVMGWGGIDRAMKTNCLEGRPLPGGVFRIHPFSGGKECKGWHCMYFRKKLNKCTWLTKAEMRDIRRGILPPW